MITLVIIGSVILHGLSLLAIINLYLRQNQIKQTEKSVYKMKRELDEALQAYLMEIKEENEQTVATLIRMKAEHEVINNVDLDKSVRTKLKKNTNHSFFVKPTNHTFANQNNFLKSEQIHYEPPHASIQDTVELTHVSVENSSSNKLDDHIVPFKKTLSEQMSKQNRSEGELASQMKEDGFSIEEIAKHLHRGKTEVELMLKFQSKTME